MLKLQTTIPLKKRTEEKEVIPRWKYKRHSFPNKKSSYWIKWKLYPDDAKFFANGKLLTIHFDKELNHLHNENISAFNDWKVTRSSYYQHLPFICEELNFFETMYDKDAELITALFRIKYLIDGDNFSYNESNFNSFKDLCYKTIFTDSFKDKIKIMIDDNYVDDIEEDITKVDNPDILTIMQRKKKSLEFKNEHVKAMLMISFGIKILSFIVNHYAVMRGINIQKQSNIFYNFYIDMFKVFNFDFDIYNKIYSYVENKVNSSYNFNKSIFEQQEIEGEKQEIKL